MILHSSSAPDKTICPDFFHESTRLAPDFSLARSRVLQTEPLIHCITHPIVINDCANAVLALGARPIMAEHPREVGWSAFYGSFEKKHFQKNFRKHLVVRSEEHTSELQSH